LQKASTEDVEFFVELPEAPLVLAFDRRLVTQAVTNLVKNAREALEPRLQNDPTHKGKIKIDVISDDNKVDIAVTDNGIGLPQENRARLTEPYMTTREKGTGLGLAIVKRIMAEHNGEISFEDAPETFAPEGGAMVTLTFFLDGTKAVETIEETTTSGKSAMSEALSAQRT
ncbi:unnamed protein product, partial [Discosporangium mesarthrocarpum]